ncbi:hypothetical protein Bca52824_020305 [Brassica carinata]|uniref:Ubiquitin-like protease family profile domain-containing protein n=1 Tax=Brassica carinata TaxID=52824 RepID=A0A8X8B0G8_BRACI|nr:hypothetical protein Bca52824_020305 [Brassica carinata]
MEEDTPDHRLPERLFATDRFPRRRLNIYSRPNILALLRHILRGSSEFTKIRDSPFGKLFDLPTRQCPVSCKLIHCLLSRQLICKLDNTLWTVFGKDPIRFGLEEFGTITGLNCGEFPNDHEAPDPNQLVANKQKNAHKDPIWKEVVGKSSNITIADLADELENDKEMSEWRRIRLALIIIVDGVLIASQQVHRPTLKYVKMLHDVDAFLQFPWGRESFLYTIRCMKPLRFDKGKPVQDPVGLLVEKLKQETYRLTGFPLALQLLAFRTIPMLQSKIPAPLHEQTIMDLTEPHLPSHLSIELNDVLLAEQNPNLVVTSTITVVRGPQPGWGVWRDGMTDGKVTYMEQLIVNKHCFAKSMWPGGDCSEPLYVATPTPVEPIHVPKKHTVLRKRKQSEPNSKKASLKNPPPPPPKKTRRTPSPTNEWLQAKVTELEATVTVLEGRVMTLEGFIEQIKAKFKRKRRRSRAGPSFPLLAAQYRRRRTLQSTVNTDHHHHDHHAGVSFDDPESPILSQYHVHHYSYVPIVPHNQDTTLPDSPERNTLDPHFPNHTTPDHSFPAHISPNHNSPNPLSPDHNSLNSPQHNSTNHSSPNHNPLSYDHHSLNFPQHNATNHSSPDHNSPNHNNSDHDPTAHKSPTINFPNHNSPNHLSSDHNPHHSPQPSLSNHTPIDRSSPVPSFEEHNSTIDKLHDPNSADSKPAERAPPAHHSTVHNSPVQEPSDPKSFEQPSTKPRSPEPSSPSHNSPVPIPPANTSPTHASLFQQVSPSQLSAPIATFPQFDATPLDKQTSPNPTPTIPEPYCEVPIYDSSASAFHVSPPTPLSPLPAVNATPISSPNKSACFSQGFSSHYSATNAFATLKGSPSMTQPTKRRLIGEDERSKDPDNELSDASVDKRIQRVVDELDAQIRVEEVHELSDSSPAKKKPPHSPDAEEKSLAEALMECRTIPHYLLIGSPPEDLWERFSSTLSARQNVFHITPSKLDFDNAFLLRLATPQAWTDSLHMTVLMHMLGERHTDMLQMDKATFAPPSLTSLMMSKERQFKAAVKKDRFHWDLRLKQLILVPGKTWMPWVGLCINLLLGHVMVFDPLPDLYNDDKALRFLKPILHMLPYLTHYVAKDTSRDLSPFTWERVPNIYQNLRSGDCGPVSAKFMEMHLYYDPHPHMANITDHQVDKSRQLYAMEAYKTIVLPAYHWYRLRQRLYQNGYEAPFC